MAVLWFIALVVTIPFVAYVTAFCITLAVLNGRHAFFVKKMQLTKPVHNPYQYQGLQDGTP